MVAQLAVCIPIAISFIADVEKETSAFSPLYLVVAIEIDDNINNTNVFIVFAPKQIIPLSLF